MFCMSQSVNSKYIPSDAFFGIQILQNLPGTIAAGVQPDTPGGAYDAPQTTSRLWRGYLNT